MRTALVLLAALALAAYSPQTLRAGSTASPHDTYNIFADDCVDCHDLEAGGGDYALQITETVTDTCGTCHYLYLERFPGYGSATQGGNSIGSAKSAYNASGFDKNSVYGHNLESGPDTFSFARPLNLADQERPATAPTLSYDNAARLACASCHDLHGPDHRSGSVAPDPASLEAAASNRAAAKELCLSCHPDRRSGLSSIHNHPDDFCLDCHADPASGAEADFPHTGQNPNLLVDEPDSLCAVCHKAGNLP